MLRRGFIDYLSLSGINSSSRQIPLEPLPSAMENLWTLLMDTRHRRLQGVALQVGVVFRRTKETTLDVD